MALTLDNVGEAVRIQEPFPGEHACRLMPPGDFEADSFRRYERKGGGKSYSVIAGHLKGESTMTEQTFRYAKGDWTPEEAKVHCEEAKGNFEAASPAPASEAVEAAIVGELVPISERAVGKDGSMNIRIVQPGWGTSGFYSKELLKREGPRAFPAGLHMHWDHPTEAQEREKPEGSLSTLAGVLESPAEWQDGGAAGPGLYARAKVFAHYLPALEEIAPHIGVSLRGRAMARTGEAEGRKGNIFDALKHIDSVDFVTLPGAGGKILQVFESARLKTEGGTEDMELKEQMDKLEGEMKTLKEALSLAQAENARLREAAIIAEAGKTVAAKLAEAKLPDVTKTRLAPMLSANPPVKDGVLDKMALESAIGVAITAESEYISKLVGDVKVRGMGESSDAPVGDKAKEAFIGMYRSMGKNAEEAKRLAELSI